MPKTNKNLPQNQPIRKTEFCTGCKYLITEEYVKGKMDIICTSEEEEHKGRMRETKKKEYLKGSNPVKPAWCKNGRYLPETEEEA